MLLVAGTVPMICGVVRSVLLCKSNCVVEVAVREVMGLACIFEKVEEDEPVDILLTDSVYPGGFPTTFLESVASGTAGIFLAPSKAASCALYGGGASPSSLSPAFSSAFRPVRFPNLCIHLRAVVGGSCP